jgi:hypothetical protein
MIWRDMRKASAPPPNRLSPASGLEGFVSDVEADMRARIRAKPIASVLIAAAVGYAVHCARRRH